MSAKRLRNEEKIPEALVEACEKLANDLIKEYKKRYSDTPPFDPVMINPEAIAKQLHIKVRKEDISRLGYALTGGGEETIVLDKKERRDYRSRWTCAHELAHILFSNLETKDINIERLCNIFAANLLMPAEYMRKFSQNIENNFSFQTFENIKKYFDVSLESVILRINELNLLKNPDYFILILKEEVNKFTGRTKKLRVSSRVLPTKADFYIPENIGAVTLGLSMVEELLGLSNLESKVVPQEHLILRVRDPHTGKYKREGVTCRAKYKCYGTTAEYKYILGLFDRLQIGVTKQNYASKAQTLLPFPPNLSR
jgi:Zn-dependent peptidase ImmA (M78 family)